MAMIYDAVEATRVSGPGSIRTVNLALVMTRANFKSKTFMQEQICYVVKTLMS